MYYFSNFQNVLTSTPLVLPLIKLGTVESTDKLQKTIKNEC